MPMLTDLSQRNAAGGTILQENVGVGMTSYLKGALLAVTNAAGQSPWMIWMSLGADVWAAPLVSWFRGWLPMCITCLGKASSACGINHLKGLATRIVIKCT